MPRIHEREQATRKAENELTIAMCEVLDKYDLTDGEYVQIVNAAAHSIIGGWARSQIRIERHGDPDTPGGWDPDNDEEDT